MMQWIGNRILDFLLKEVKTRLKFEGQIHFRHRIFVMFGVDIMMTMFNMLLYIPSEQSATEYEELLTRFLRLHRRYHQLSGNQTCCICLNVALFEPHFEKYVSEAKLYPPFSF
jgi:hypothetical protein